MANDLQQVGAKALGRAPQPLRRALDGLGIQFKQENGPTQAMANGHQYGNIAGVAQRDPSTISVMQPDVFRKNADQLVTHEGVHSWQNNLPPSIQNAIPPDNPNDPYNFGGTEGVKSVLAKGGTLANMPREQAAAAMQYGQSQGMPEPYRKLANTINDIPLSQIEQTSPDQKGINTKPRAPQVPPASVPGMNYAAATYKPGDPAPGDMTASMLGPMPDLGQPQAPQATYAPSPQQQNIDNDQQQLQKVRFAQANPWGTANNHPGTMGKIAHVLSVAGNIAGNIVAPNIMANIPGTQMNMNVREHGLQNQVDQETGELSQNQARDAGTQGMTLANQQEPQKFATDQALKQSQINKNEQDKAPKPDEFEYKDTDHGLLAINKRTREVIPVTLNGQPIAKPATDKPDPEKQQLIDEYQKMHPGATLAQAAQYAARATQAPQRPPVVNVLVPDGKGGYVDQAIHPGSTVGAGAMTVGGLNSETVSGDKQKAAADKARQDMQNEYQLAQTLVSHPSPTNDLALVMRYIGATKPDSLGKLRLNNNEVNLVMGTRSTFGDLQALAQKVQSGQMLTPHQRQDMLGTMKLLTGQGQAPQGGPQPGMVEDGHRFKGGNPGDPKNWEKVQ